MLFAQGIKVLSLFFIDAVAKYQLYDENGEKAGEYARIFEEEYTARLKEILTLEDTPYNRYLRSIATAKTHQGYFSIDRKTRRLVDPEVKTRGEFAGEADDARAYDLILKDKARLLSFDEPVRFLFSHSALREGWDNPNVFVICTLKHSDNTVSRRHEVGRGMRLAVNQRGDRMDDPATAHQINVLTVVANESYRDFVAGLQKEISATLSTRPKLANAEYFQGKVFKTLTGEVKVTPRMAKLIERYLVDNDYFGAKQRVTEVYHEAKRSGNFAALPDELEPYKEQVFQLIDSVVSTHQLPEIEDDRQNELNRLNTNFSKKEFQDLWSRINREAIYAVKFETDELVSKCITTLDRELKSIPLRYSIARSEQSDATSSDEVKKSAGFRVLENQTKTLTTPARSTVRYDLVGKVVTATQLTRKTVAAILSGINVATFSQYRINPEDFILKAVTLINEQKATVIVEHLAYSPLEDEYGKLMEPVKHPKADASPISQP